MATHRPNIVPAATPRSGRDHTSWPATVTPTAQCHRASRRRVARWTVAVGAIAFAVVPGAPVARAAEAALESRTQTALALTPDPKSGHARFDRNCARCHGAGGRGDVNPRVPVLAGQRPTYLVRQLATLSDEERESVNMRHAMSAADLHEPQAWADIAAYLGGARLPSHPQTGAGRHLALGEATYRILCASCHHDDAGGDDEGFVPSVRNQNFAYLLSQMERISALHRRGVDENFAALLRSLKPDEASGLADYLSRQHGPTPVR